MGKAEGKKSAQQVWENIRVWYQTACQVLERVWYVVYRSRKLLLSIPVIVLAVYLAGKSQSMLPEHVGIWLMEDGSFKYMVSQEMAIYAPLALTGGCLVMMFCSRRTVYPWLISLFSLVVPLLVLLINVFPA